MKKSEVARFPQASLEVKIVYDSPIESNNLSMTVHNAVRLENIVDDSPLRVVSMTVHMAFVDDRTPRSTEFWDTAFCPKHRWQFVITSCSNYQTIDGNQTMPLCGTNSNIAAKLSVSTFIGKILK
jgi:hypothetical protein